MPLTVLVSRRPRRELLEQILAIAPEARIVTADDLRQQPDLLAAVDIAYGNLRPDRFAQARRLKWLQSASAGVDWVEHEAVLSHPAVVTNARIHAVQIAEHLFGMLLMLTHRLHMAYARQREHVWKAPEGSVRTLPSRTLCVLGLGTIGRRCAALGRAHDMRVIGVRRHPDPTPDVERVFATEELNEALARGDVVMNLLPGTPHTRGIIGRAQFQALPAGAIFLNAGRGKTADTAALVEALRSGKLGGAGLDVVDPEPLPPDHPLWDMPNVILTPHCSGQVDTYDRQADEVFLENLRRFLAGRPMLNVVDKSAGY